MQIIPGKHRPVKLNTGSSDPQRNSASFDLESVIHSKLTNELLELEEFRKLSLQKVSELLQRAEQELLETAQRVMISLNDLCEIAHRDISSAISLINFRDTSNNYILNMFKSCKSAEEVRNLGIIHKSLIYVPFNVVEIINSSICFNLQITQSPSEIDLKGENLQKLTFGLSPSQQNFKVKASEQNTASPSVKRSISNIEVELVNKRVIVERSITEILERHENPSLLPGNIPRIIYYFMPGTNRIVWFNAEDSSFHDIQIHDRIFFKDSAWSLCEGNKIMNTGGCEFQVKDSVFLFNLETRTEIKAPSLPNRRCKHAQVALGKFVYVVGGLSKKGSLKSVDKFNLESGKWRKAGNLSFPREHPGCCTHDGKIYIVGGVGCSAVEIYNPISKKFFLLNLKTPSPGRNCLFSYDDCILILAGESLMKFIPRSMSIIEKGKVESFDWNMSGDPYVMDNNCFFFYIDQVFQLSISDCVVSCVGKAP
jgi:predicted component of type VI protein secretion system